MDQDKHNIKDELVKCFSQLEKTSPPKGFASACEDIDIDIYEYDGYIAGLVRSYLSGSDIAPMSVDQGDDLDRRLDECEAKLRDLRAYKDMISEIATLLVECLSDKS